MLNFKAQYCGGPAQSGLQRSVGGHREYLNISSRKRAIEIGRRFPIMLYSFEARLITEEMLTRPPQTEIVNKLAAAALLQTPHVWRRIYRADKNTKIDFPAMIAEFIENTQRSNS